MRLLFQSLALTLVSSAAAQPDPVPSARQAALSVEVPPSTRVPRARVTRARRSRAFFAAGTLMLSIGALHLASFAPNRCSEDYSPSSPTKSRWAGAILGGLGVGLTIGSGIVLFRGLGDARDQLRRDRRARRRFRWRTAGVATLLLMSSLALGLTEFFTCVST